MDPSLLNQIIVAVATLAASLGGYVLAGWNERRRDERALKNDLEKRKAERAAQFEDGVRERQRDTLLALQDAVQLMARYTGRAMHFDHMQARNGEYAQLPEAWSTEGWANGVEVRRLTSRVLDPAIRRAVEEFHAVTTTLSATPRDLMGLVGQDLEDRVQMKYVELNTAYESVSNIMGDAVRQELDRRPNQLTD